MKVRLKHVTNYSNVELVTKSSTVPDYWFSFFCNVMGQRKGTHIESISVKNSQEGNAILSHVHV